ncbi:hypothetical protein D3H55_04915 [Bacillus salacetis]|uniref:Uncharacterized protein n=1 Tax=Bacillus salacetis TaxID=2315464 RepID=A0A3A1R4T1_9BACI|nr:hypothetical protein [Bacillus salacetis]RIW37377.1 hypothetical protein D3H55_04915 [Bacillus salacetis]
MKGKKSAKWDRILHWLVGAAVAFAMFQWSETNNELKTYEVRHVIQLNYQFKELHSILFSMEETLDTYQFPIDEDKENYYQDALDNDIQRLDHLGHSIQQLNDYPDFRIVNQSFGELENIVKGLKGFQYTEAEKNSATEALSKTQSELYALLEKDEFTVELEEDRAELLTILDNLVKNLSVLKKY